MRFVGEILELTMIRVTRINHTPLILNSDLIEHIETTPDTVISLNNGQKYVVREAAEDVVEKVVEFRRRIFSEIRVS
jgi:flagellar protein FlbD